jgi:hypothetical protein
MRLLHLASSVSGGLCLLVTLAAGCAGNSSGQAGSGGGPRNGVVTGTPTGAQRAIAEADIIQLDGGRLYALSKSGTASIVDVSAPGRLELLGQTTVRGTPFEMYRRGDFLVVMSNAAVTSDGSLTTGQGRVDNGSGSGAGALVAVLDVRDPAALDEVATLKVPGEVADSRVVGNVLYLATYENAGCYGCGTAPRTMVTSFDIATPKAIKLVEQVSFESNAPDGYNLPWGANWKRSIFVTTERLYIGGHADVDPNSYGTAKEGIIDVLDVTDPGGRLKIGARITVAGAILSRWQLEERSGVLRVVSQQGAGRTANGIGAPEVDTFRVENSASFLPLGHMVMRLPRQEGLRAVRFDANRAYAITYNQTDPLFVIDLADPARPVQRGELLMPGFMYHLEPRGDRIIGLGIDRTDANGSLNVSLFDVADADHPRMLARVPFATPNITEDFAILDGEIAEDQDRIQKAFRVFPDGVVVVPFSAPLPYYATGQSCDNNGGGVQLVQWQGDTLTKRALLPLPGNPRRAFENGGEMVTVSDSNVRAFSLENMAVAHQTADLVIGTCVPDPNPYYGGGGGFVGGGGGYYEESPRACSALPGPPSGLDVIGLALAFFLLATGLRRRRSA